MNRFMRGQWDLCDKLSILKKAQTPHPCLVSPVITVPDCNLQPINYASLSF